MISSRAQTNDLRISDSPVDTIVFSAGTVTADGAEVFASGKRVIRRVGCDRFVLSARRGAEEVAVTTSVEGSYMQRRE